MSVFFVCNDSAIEAERCSISLARKSTITVFAFDLEGRLTCFTGIVHSIQFDDSRGPNKRWRVAMHDTALALISEVQDRSGRRH